MGKNISLFKDSPKHFHHNACVGWSHNQWHIYTTGYMRAMEILEESIIKEPVEIDFLIYPYLFLNRHYLELKMKEIILQNEHFNGKETDKIFNMHNLEKLWDKCKKISKDFSTYEYDYEDFDKVINDFVARDPESLVFRYPISRFRKQFFCKSERINILKFKERIHGLREFLMGLSEYMYGLKQNS